MKHQIPSLEDCVEQIKEENSYELYCERLKKIAANARYSGETIFDSSAEARHFLHVLNSLVKCKKCTNYSLYVYRCFLCKREVCSSCTALVKSKEGAYEYFFCKDCLHPEFKVKQDKQGHEDD